MNSNITNNERGIDRSAMPIKRKKPPPFLGARWKDLIDVTDYMRKIVDSDGTPIEDKSWEREMSSGNAVTGVRG